MSVIEDVRKVLPDFVAPQLREIKGRLDAQSEQLEELRDYVKLLNVKLDNRFEDLRADLRLSQRVEQIERTLRQSSQQ